MRPFTYGQVADEYEKFTKGKKSDISLSRFAQLLDDAEGATRRASAYNDNWIKRADHAINTAVESTGLPAVGRYAGQSFGELLGLEANTIDVLGDVGHYTPRVLGEGLMTLVSPASSIPRYAAYGARALGYGSAAARGYAESDSVLGAAIAPAQLAAGNYLLPVLGNRALMATQNWLNKANPITLPAAATAGRTTQQLLGEVPNLSLAQRGPALAMGAKVGTELTAGVGLNEATRQGMLTAQGVPLTEWDARNPFTEENIAANVGGLVPFTPFFINSFRKAPKVNIQAIDKLQAWLGEREAFLATQTPDQTPGGTKPVPIDPALQQSGLLPTMLRNASANYERAMQDGNIAWANRARNSIRDLLFHARPKDFAGLKQSAEELQAIARMAAPDTPQGWETFINEYNSIVEQYWRNLYDENVIKTDATGPKAGQKQVWHPEARHPSVLKDLQESGYLPKITPEYVAEQYGLMFDRAIGDPRTASRAVAQKLANDMLDRVDAAVKSRETLELVDVEPSQKKQQKTELEIRTEERYLDALMRLPKEVRDAAMMRHVEMQQNIDSGKGDFQTGGTPHSYYHGWRDLVIQAAQTYDDSTGTFIYKRPKRQLDPKTGQKRLVKDAAGNPVFIEERRLLSDLFAKSLDSKRGKYLLYPEARAITPREGGKLRGETSLDAPMREEGRTGHEVTPDEGQLWTDLAEGKYGLPGDEKGVAQDLGEGFVRTPSEPTAEVGDPGFVNPTPDEATKLTQVGEKVRTTLDTLSNDQVWQAVAPMYEQISKTGKPIASSTNSFRAKNFKLALEALGEEGWGGSQAAKERPLGKAGKQMLELMKERRMVVPREGMTDRALLLEGLKTFFRRGNTGTLQEHLMQVMERIVDPTVLDVLKNNPRAKAMVLRDFDLLESGLPAEHTLATKGDPDFQRDFITQFKSEIYTRMGQYGYSGQMRDLMTEVAAAIATKQTSRSVEFYRLSGEEARGMAGLASRRGIAPDKAAVGINFDVLATQHDLRTEIGRAAYFTELIQTSLHELSHVNDYIRAGFVTSDAYADQSRRILDGVYELAGKLSPAERQVIMRTVRDGLYPEEFQKGFQTRPDGTIYGDTPQEFIAQVNALIEPALLLGKKRKLDTLDFLPNEVQEYMRMQFRAVGDVLDVLRPQVEKVHGKTVAAALDSMVQTTRAASKLRNADIAFAQGRQLLAGLEPGVAGSLASTAGDWKVQTLDGDFYTNAKPSATAEQALTQARELVRVADRTELGAKPGFMQKFYPFYNLMHSMERAGVPLARDVWNLAASITPAIHRIESAILAPWLTRNKQGRFEFDSNHALVRAVAERPDGKWRKALNIVRRWQNENDGKTVFVQDENGVITPTKEGKELWDRMSKTLTPEDQQVVMNGSVAMDQTFQKAGALLTGSLFESINNRVAATLMAMNRKSMTWEQGRQLSSEILAGYLNGDVSGIGNKVPPEQLKMIGSLLAGEDGLLKHFEQVQQHLKSRPGFSTESLPHDWIIEYQKQGEKKKTYLSARNEKEAMRFVKTLQDEGATILREPFDKKQANQFHDFDMPDELVGKFVELENRVWDRVLSEVEQGFGPEQAQFMKEAYMPGEAAIKETEKTGWRKFMLQNEGKIDRQKFDYLEGMEAYVSRMASTIAFRSVRQQLNLILADPRGKPYETFRQQVQTQFDFIFSPTSTSVSEWKSMLSGYFLGANLSSALVESTQSLVTLVPQLINVGKAGIATAYRQLWGGMADLVNFRGAEWQARARRAKQLDPSKLDAESERLLMYERAVHDGLIDHGVIQDLNFGRDQRLLLTAKFGRGELSDQTVGQMVKDKAYVGSQFMMRFYSWAALANTKIAFMSGVRNGQSLGLKGDALYNHARQVKDLATFGGGKANMPTYVSQWSSPYTRNAFVMMHTLQQYGMGMFASYAQLAKDSIGKSLPPGQRLQARKALGTMLITQTALAGSFGLPFTAAMLTMLEKTFGIEAHRAVREGIASLAGRDEDGNITESGAILADFVLNGAGNQLFGIDMSSRVGVSNLFGTSAYRGFNMADMLGPLPSVLENMYNALGNFAQGEPVKAARDLVPQAFKNSIALADTKAKYGDHGFRDQSGNLLHQPSQGQVAAYMFGFRPKELGAKRQAQQMMMLSEDNAQRARARELDQAAQGLLQGNPQVTYQLVDKMLSVDPLLKREDVMRQVIARAADAQMEKDITARGIRGNDENRLSIARAFGPQTVSRRSEVDHTMLQIQTAMQLGQPGLYGPDALGRAAMVDALVESGMSRGQAVQMLSFLGR